jgi:hypothetical protein
MTLADHLSAADDRENTTRSEGVLLTTGEWTHLRARGTARPAPTAPQTADYLMYCF